MKLKNFLAMFLSLVLIFTSFAIAPVQAETTSLVSEVAMVSKHHLEVRFSENVSGVNATSDFNVYINGVKLNSNQYSYWCYFDNFATIYINEKQDEPLTNIIEVQITDSSIKGTETSTSVDTSAYYTAVYDPHYKKTLLTKSGILIKAPEQVEDSSIIAAGRQVDILLAKCPDVAEELASNNASLAIIAPDENPYYVLEHRQGHSTSNYWVEGYGGTPYNNYTSSITEKNINRWLNSNLYPATTSYTNENILAHEFGHAIKLCGIDLMDDSTLANLIKSIYSSVRSKGLWNNTYAASNIDEYWATMINIWFNTQSETANFNGTWSPINTRAELKVYDPETYALLEQVFYKTTMPSPWDTNVNNYDYSGGADPDEFDSSTVEYNTEIWKYSESSNGYVFVNSNSGKIITVNNDSVNENAVLIQSGEFDDDISASGTWKILFVTNGHYSIVNANSSMALAVQNKSSSSVIQKTADNSDNSQIWSIESAGNGKYKIINKLSGLVLDVENSSVNNGAGIIQKEYTGNESQLWDILNFETKESFEAIDFSELSDLLEEAYSYNEEDYVTFTFEALTSAIGQAEYMLKYSDVTQTMIENAVSTIKTAINKLISYPDLTLTRYPASRPSELGNNIAPNASVTTSYVTGWNYNGAVNDNYPSDPTATYSRVAENYAWGTWPEAGPHTVTLTWDEAVTVDSIDILWHCDAATGANGGVQLPENAFLYYLNSEGKNVPVQNCSLIGNSGGTSSNVFNFAEFDAITTTQLTLLIYSNRTASAVGIVEFMVYEAPAPVVDTTELETLLETAASYSADEYTENSYQALQDAINSAQNLLSSPSITSDGVSQAITYLTGAINGLVKIGANTDEITVTSDKDKYAINSDIILTIITPGDVQNIGIFNTNNKAISKKSISYDENKDGTLTWTIVIQLGTKGSRTLNIWADTGNGLKDSGSSVSFEVVTQIIGPTDECDIISVSPEIVTAGTNETIQLTVITTKGANRIAMYNEYDKVIHSTQKYIDSDGQRIWTLSFSVGTKGERKLTVKASDNSDSWIDKTITFDAYIGVPAPSDTELELYSVEVSGDKFIVNNSITVLSATSTSVSKIKLTNENGKTISSSSTYKDIDGVRYWTTAFSVGTKGNRTIYLYAGDGTNWAAKQSFNITVYPA